MKKQASLKNTPYKFEKVMKKGILHYIIHSASAQFGIVILNSYTVTG
jgi:hypothetical protein